MITRELSPVGFNNFCLKSMNCCPFRKYLPIKSNNFVDRFNPQNFSFQTISGNMMFENNF